jgi:hypothetical protein
MPKYLKNEVSSRQRGQDLQETQDRFACSITLFVPFAFMKKYDTASADRHDTANFNIQLK